MTTSKLWFKTLILTLFFWTITACSGGSSSVETIAPVTKAFCVTTDEENTDDNCGTLLVGVTDADGDFLSYSVNITAIELTRRDGTVVSVLPTPQTVDFTDYVDL